MLSQHLYETSVTYLSYKRELSPADPRPEPGGQVGFFQQLVEHLRVKIESIRYRPLQMGRPCVCSWPRYYRTATLVLKRPIQNLPPRER